MVLVLLIIYIIGFVVDFTFWGKEDSIKEYIKNFARSLFWPIRWLIIVLTIRLWFKNRKLTIIGWSQGVPTEEGRYLVQIYSGAVDIDYYNNNGWEKYNHKEIIMWSKITKLEEELRDE